MAQNALTGSHIAKFKETELHKFLSVITDSRGPRVVVHEFPYRDGGQVETLGRRPHRSEWALTFTGPDWKETFLDLARSIDDNPAGILIHPIYGQMRVVCQGFDRAVVNVVEATDTISFTLTFLEDQADLGIEEKPTVSSIAQDANSAVTAFDDSASVYLSDACVAAVAGYVGSATAFVSAALLSAQNLTVDASLPSLVTNVGAALATVQEALQADPVALSSVAQVYDALASSEVVYALCLDLYDELSLETLSFVRHVVAGRTSVAVLAQLLYGSNAINFIDQMLSLNPQITDPTNIPAGMVLTLPSASAAAL